MCGICGSAGPGNNEPFVRSMLARLTHRGPDDEGLWSGPNVVLGQRRLSIVDLSSAGHQPMTTPDQTIAATVNGEIYNYPDLRKTLEASGARFRSNSDSEVVLHAYRAHGVEAFGQLNGMFAFGLWDGAANKLFVVRDRLGIKPVYFWQDPATNRFHFASEIKALLAAAGRRRWPINAEGLSQYLTFQNTMGGATLLEGVRMVPPGHYVEYHNGQIRVDAYWRPQIPSAAGRLSFEDAVGQFREKFSRAVGRHLMSDVPVACYLSSGFDSSMVTAEAARQMQERPLAYTGHFDQGEWYDETTGAEIIARHLGVEPRRVSIGAADFERYFDDVVRSLDEPRMGMGAFPQFMVARAAAADRKVILTGHGGDELFSGYPVFKLAMLMEKIRGLDPSIVRDVGSLNVHELPHLAFFAGQKLGRADTFLPVLFGPAAQARLLQPAARDALRAYEPVAVLSKRLQPARSDYERILLTYLTVYLPGLLTVEDKISMAHALEARTPFLDNEIVDFSLGLPADVKLHAGRLKAIVKSAARGMLPDEIFTFPKRGFPTPLSAWLRGPLAEWTRRRLCHSSSRLHEIFDRSSLTAFVENYLSSWRRHVRPLDELPTHRMWMLLCLESWLRQMDEVYSVTVTVDR